MPLPVIDLGILMIKQISKPFANALKKGAASNPFFRNKILMPPAQLYYKLDRCFKINLLGVSKTSIPKSLDQEKAIDLVANMLGEFAVYSIAVGLVFLEYKRQQYKEQSKNEKLFERIFALEPKLTKINEELTKQSQKLANIKLSRTLPVKETPQSTDAKLDTLTKNIVVESRSKQHPVAN